MKGSFYLGSIAKIRLFVHWTFFILPAWIAMVAYNQGHSTETIAWSILFIFAIFLCVTLHEYGHALTAKVYGYKTKNITLLPIGGVANMETLPENPKQEFNIAIAGPTVNVVIAALLYGYLYFTNGLMIDLEDLTVGSGNFLFILMSANLFIAAFNMIPAFPMDGGRVLRALLAFRISRTDATRITSAIGQFIAVLFIIFGFFYNFFLIIIGLFVLFGARSEWFIEHSRFMLGEHKVQDILIHQFKKLSSDMTLGDVVRELLDSTETHFLVMQDDEVVGTLNKEIILKSVATHENSTPITAFMNTDLQTLSPDMPLSEVYNPQKKSFKVNGQLMPVMKDNQLIGVLDLENILEFIQLKTALKLRKASSASS